MNTQEIKFPEGYTPSISSVHVRNEINIKASAENIWFWLTNITTWPAWYANASDIQILNHEDKFLAGNTQFNWRTFNTNIKSEVKEYKSNQNLAWVAKGNGLLAYHSWLIVPTNSGCQVITEETQQGWLPKLFGFFIKKGLLKQHQLWLEGLKQKAEEIDD